MGPHPDQSSLTAGVGILGRREKHSESIAAGGTPDFLPETSGVRDEYADLLTLSACARMP